MPNVANALMQVFSLDLRALAVMRMAMATTLLLDLAIRSTDLSAWLSDGGVLPRHVLLDDASPWRFSFHLANGSTLWAAFLSGTAAIFAVMLLIGWRTRLATVVSFLLLMSLHNRNPMVLQGGDNLLLLMLFWSMLLPLGARFSVDCALARQQLVPNRYVSFATAGILLQAMSVYFFSAFLKSAPEWLPDGTAIYYALQLDMFATPIAHLWRDELWLSRPLSIYVWFLELVGPVLMFTPVFRLPVRTIVALCFVTLEVAFIFNLRIGLFPLISLTSLVLFFQTEIWDAIERWSKSSKGGGLTLYYDRGCEFCEKTCHLLKTFLLLRDAEIAPAQSVPEIGALLEKEFSWVVTDRDGGRYTRSEALAVTFSHSPWGRLVAPLIRSAPSIGDRVYHWIGNRRGAFGAFFARALPWRESVWRPGTLAQVVAAFFIVYIGWWNLTTVRDWNPFPGARVEALDGLRARFPASLLTLRDALRLDQKWNMFAPSPRTVDGWLVLPGLLENGQLVDAKNGTSGPPSFEKPESFYATQFGNYRWRKYFVRLTLERFTERRRYYGRWLCRQWNASAAGDARLRAFNIYFVVERTPPPGKPFTVSRRKLWRHFCFELVDDDPVERAIGHS